MKFYSNLETLISKEENKNRQIKYAYFFFLFTVIALFIDSTYFFKNYFDGRIITNVLALIYFLLFYQSVGLELKKLMLVMVPLSYIGELIFCKLLGMYEYRTDTIPFYVPLGHAIVYASGTIFSKTIWATLNEGIIRKIFLSFFILLFLGVALFLNDIFSIFFGSLFFLILKRKKWDNMYCFIAMCVIFIELVGTMFNCWKWIPKIFHLFPASNPPMGAIFFYAGGDLLLGKIVSYWKK